MAMGLGRSRARADAKRWRTPKPGMKLPGIVANVAAYAAFVDVSVHQLHVSQLCDGFIGFIDFLYFVCRTLIGVCCLAITTRPFGKIGPAVTQVGLGGEGVLRTFGRKAEAVAVIEEAALQGITYFDSARAYAGSESYYGAFWSEHSSSRRRVFQTSKSASRDKEGARGDLVRALARVGREFQPLSAEEEKRLVDLFRPHARRLAFYRGAF